MKRVASILLYGILIIVLVACSSQPALPAETPTTTTTVTTTTTTQNTIGEHIAAYQDILEDYAAVIDFRLSEDFEERYENGDLIKLKSSVQEELDLHNLSEGNWYGMLLEMTRYNQFTSAQDFGYIFKDINGDQTPELFWVNRDREILAIFTVVDEKVRLIDAFRSRYACKVLDNGKLLQLSNNTVYTVSTLNENGASLETELIFGQDPTIEEVKYFQNTNGEIKTLTEEEYLALCAQYPFEDASWWKELELFSVQVKP